VRVLRVIVFIALLWFKRLRRISPISDKGERGGRASGK
jgi:hypothetical protein